MRFLQDTEYIHPEPNTKNYQRMMEEIITLNRSAEKKPRLLLHSCCAPCSSAVLSELAEDFKITLFYYNPNISTEEEFLHRASELKRLVYEMKLDTKGVDILVPPYDHGEFIEIARGHERDPERGERCHRCYRQRLEKTAAQMLLSEKEGIKYDYFCTTLTLSPLKSAEILNRIGEETAAKYGVRFLPSDFKKKGGYQRSILLSKEYNLYRQNFCGCEFSR